VEQGKNTLLTSMTQGQSKRTDLLKLRERVLYFPGPEEYVILPEHSFEDVLYHLFKENDYDSRELIEMLQKMQADKNPDRD